MPKLFLKIYLPASIAFSLMSYAYARNAGWDVSFSVLISGLVIFLATLVLERYWPYRAEWNRSRGDVTTDLASTVVLLGALEPLLKLLVPLMLAQAAVLFPVSPYLFPREWPLWSQILLVTLTAEFFYYWSHRWHHRYRPLWWLHALHHSSERLYALNNFRIHPVNHMLNHLVAMVPLMWLGAPQEAIVGYLAIVQPVILLQHTNLDLDNGLLNYVFSTNEIHRWHHSRLPTEANSNFGRGLIVWDQIFGTFRYSAAERFTDQVGLFSDSQYPVQATYAGQVFSLFRRGCCR